MANLHKSLLNEATLYKEAVSPKNPRLVAVRNDILKYVQDVGQRGDLKEIVATERVLLESELEHHTNSALQKSSLETALTDLSIAQKLIHVVSNKAAYSPIANAYKRPKNRPLGLPLDEARQAFASHATRLANPDKIRISDLEKAIFNARRQNITHAHLLYRQEQAKTLGVSLEKASRKKTPEAKVVQEGDLEKKMQEYAATIKNPKERETFLNHMQAAQRKVQETAMNTPKKATTNPTKHIKQTAPSLGRDR